MNDILFTCSTATLQVPLSKQVLIVKSCIYFVLFKYSYKNSI